MIRKSLSMLVALLGFSLTGCAAYGDGGYSADYRDYDRQYYPGAHEQHSQVYAAPRVYVYEDRRYDRRYAPPRYSAQPRYHAPPPPVHYYNRPGYEARYHERHDRNRRDYRPSPRPGWEGQRHHYQQQRQRTAPLQWQQREAPQRFQRGWTRER